MATKKRSAKLPLTLNLSALAQRASQLDPKDVKGSHKFVTELTQALAALFPTARMNRAIPFVEACSLSRLEAPTVNRGVVYDSHRIGEAATIGVRSQGPSFGSIYYRLCWDGTAFRNGNGLVKFETWTEAVQDLLNIYRDRALVERKQIGRRIAIINKVKLL